MGMIVIGAEHPTLGTVYRRHCDESRSNLPDEYTLTTQVHAATTVDETWRESPEMRLRMGERFIHRALASSGSTDERMSGALLLVQIQSEQSPYEFYCWLHTAAWVDLPAPAGLNNPISD